MVDGRAQDRVRSLAVEALDPLVVTMPDRRAVAVLQASLEDGAGQVLQRNFTTFVVGDGPAPRDEALNVDGHRLRVLRAAAAGPRLGEWSLRRWAAMDGKKQNGAGSGWFEYRLPWPQDLAASAVAGATFVAELGAKELFGKDRPQGAVQGDFMRGEGTHYLLPQPERLPDDGPADAPERGARARQRRGGRPSSSCPTTRPTTAASCRGSRRSGRRSRRSSEAGSYGYLVSARDPGGSPRRGVAQRARSCCGWRWTRRCPGGSRSTAGRAVAMCSTRPWR